MRILMRGAFGHAVDVLRRDPLIDERLGDDFRDRRTGHVEGLHVADAGQPPRLLLRQNVHRMRRNAKNVGCASLDDPVQTADAAGRIIRDHLTAADEPLTDRHPGDVMRQGTEGKDDGVSPELPVTGKVARICKQGIAGVHHTFWSARRSRSEGQVRDAVGIAVRFSLDLHDALRKSLRRVDLAKERQSSQHRFKIPASPVRTPVVLGHDGLGTQLREEIDDLRAGIGPVQGRIACDPFARARQEGNDRLDAVRHPYRDPVAGADFPLHEIVGKGIHASLQAPPVEKGPPVPERLRVWSQRRMSSQQSVEGVVCPEARVIVPAGCLWIVQCQKGSHRSALFAKLGVVRLAALAKTRAVLLQFLRLETLTVKRNRPDRAVFLIDGLRKFLGHQEPLVVLSCETGARDFPLPLSSISAVCSPRRGGSERGTVGRSST